MEASTDLFINLIQNNRIIYDKSLKDFKNTRKKEEVWQNIAAQSRMTVEAAKKRYAALRQKYSREKRNNEVKRRYKTGTVRYWVYFERLHFLDSFVQPRSTYTNDTMFKEDADDDDVQMYGNGDLSCTDTPKIDVELYNNDHFGEEDGASSETQQHQDLQIVETRQNHDHNYNWQIVVDENAEQMIRENIISEYSGEVSTYDYLNSQNDQNNDSAVTTEEQFGEPNDGDDYMSPNPGTSSSQAIIPRLAPNAPTTANNLTVLSNSKTQSSVVKQPPNKSSDTRSLPQQRINLSGPKKTIPRKNVVGHESTVSFNQTVPTTAPTTAPTTHQTASSAAAANDKRMEAIRQRMESCLTAITNKVNDSGQRSPHAPFLAYLGTRLRNVPNEILPDLEREILELVERHSH